MRSLTATEGLLTNRANLFSAGSDFDLRALFGVAGSAEDGPPSAVAATAFRLGLTLQSHESEISIPFRRKETQPMILPIVDPFCLYSSIRVQSTLSAKA
jgi:hypothetical protein